MKRHDTKLIQIARYFCIPLYSTLYLYTDYSFLSFSSQFFIRYSSILFREEKRCIIFSYYLQTYIYNPVIQVISFPRKVQRRVIILHTPFIFFVAFPSFPDPDAMTLLLKLEKSGRRRRWNEETMGRRLA